MSRRALFASLGVVVLSAVALLATVQLATAAPNVIGMQPEASYNGTSIPVNDAAKLGLACIQRETGKMVCFDSRAEAAASPVAASEARKSGATVADSSVARKKHRARASVDCNYPDNAMVITRDRDFNWNSTGWQLIGYARQTVYAMSGGYNNSATSLSGGNHSGWLADNQNGSGQRATIGVGGCSFNLSVGYGFNDRAGSRYRN